MSVPIFIRSKLNNLEQGSPDWRRRVLDPAWVRERVKVYLRYTVASLKRQTDQNFVTWLDCRPGSERDLEPCLLALIEAGVKVTFDRGVELIGNLPGTVCEVQIIRLDSDDMLGPEAVALARQHHPPGRIGAVFLEGYVCDFWRFWRQTHRSPPFYSERFGRDWAELVPRCRYRMHGDFRAASDAIVLPRTCPHFLWLRHRRPGFHVWTGALAKGLKAPPKLAADLRAYFHLDKGYPDPGPEVRALLEGQS